MERSAHFALETYSNVHRGTGYNSMVTTHLFKQARNIVLDYLGLSRSKFIVIFCTPRRAAALREQVGQEMIQSVSSREIGLPLGLVALAIKRKALPKGIPYQTGGGTTRLIAPKWIVWANSPDKFEAGTPAIINIIAFARALQMIRSGQNSFMEMTDRKLSAAEILYHDELDEFTGQQLLDKLRTTCMGRAIPVPTLDGPKNYINLDNAASTPTFTPIWNAVRQTWRQASLVQEEIIHEVRSICSAALGAPLDTFDVIFTSNTTEAINMVAESLGSDADQDIEPVILNTILEHSSNDLPWRMISRHSLIRLTIDDDGFIDLNELDSILNAYNMECLFGRKRIRLVAVSGASNVLGFYNNLADISRIVHLHGAQLLVDGAQLVAHRKVEMEKWGIDFLAFSAHKVYAPFGTGALVVRKGLLNFSTTELDLIRSSGEENAGGIAGLGKALVLLQRIGMDVIVKEEQELTSRALLGLAQIPGLRIYGIRTPVSPGFEQKGGVICFTIKGIMPGRLAKELSLRSGIGVRYGCHCAHLLVKRLLHVGPGLELFQRVLLTLFPKIPLPGILRVSFGIQTTNEELDTLIRVLGELSMNRKILEGRDTVPVQTRKTSLSKARVKRQIMDYVKKASEKVYPQTS